MRFVLILLLALPVAGVRGESYEDWVRLDRKVAAAYKVSSPLPDQVGLRDLSDGGEKKQVMVLFPKSSSAYDTALQTILGVFRNKGMGADFTLINFHNNESLGEKALEMAGRYDLIFSMGSDSTAFVFKHYAGGAVPVVSVCSKDPVFLGQIGDYEKGSGTNMAFTSLNIPVDLQLEFLFAFNPQLENIAVLYAADNLSAVKTQVLPLMKAGKKRGLLFFEVVVNDQSRGAEELEDKLPKVIRRMENRDKEKKHSLLWITGSTSVFNEMETINKHAGGFPVLSVVPDVVREGEASALLSIGVSFENNAYLGAKYAIAILSGETKPGDLKVGVVTPPDIAINFLKLKEAGINIPFSLFESAATVYDYSGRLVRKNGQNTGEVDE